MNIIKQVYSTQYMLPVFEKHLYLSENWQFPKIIAIHFIKYSIRV